MDTVTPVTVQDHNQDLLPTTDQTMGPTVATIPSQNVVTPPVVQDQTQGTQKQEIYTTASAGQYSAYQPSPHTTPGAQSRSSTIDQSLPSPTEVQAAIQALQSIIPAKSPRYTPTRSTLATSTGQDADFVIQQEAISQNDVPLSDLDGTVRESIVAMEERLENNLARFMDDLWLGPEMPEGLVSVLKQLNCTDTDINLLRGLGFISIHDIVQHSNLPMDEYVQKFARQDLQQHPVQHVLLKIYNLGFYFLQIGPGLFPGFPQDGPGSTRYCQKFNRDAFKVTMQKHFREIRKSFLDALQAYLNDSILGSKVSFSRSSLGSRSTGSSH